LLADNGDNDSGEETIDTDMFILNGEEDVALVGVAVSDAEKTVIDIDIEGVRVTDTEEDSEVFQILTISGYATTSEVGKPQLPVIRDTIAIPDGAMVKATVLEASYNNYTGYKVYPVQPPEFDCEMPSNDLGFTIDTEFYSQDLFYPEELVEVGAPGIWRDLSIVNIQINPVMFNPATGELRVYDHIKVELAYEGGVIERKEIKPEFARMYQSVILNYDSLDVLVTEEPHISVPDESPKAIAIPDNLKLDNSDAPTDTYVKYLSLRHEDCSDFNILWPLLNWHGENGLPYESYSYASGASPTAQEIKDFVLNYYAAHPELEYLLLVGDIAYLPWKDDWDGVPSDSWFGCLAGNDLYAEIAVGRFTVTSNSELQTQVDKTLNYLNNPPSGNWADKALLIAHKQKAPGEYQGCKEDIRTASYSDTFIFDTAYGAAPAQGGESATNADVKSAIDSGRGIANYRGHGGPGSPDPRPWGTYWGTDWNTANEEYTTTNAHNLANGGRTPVVFSISCLNAALDNADECLGESFIKDSQSAVAFLGAARPSYTIPNHEFDKYLFDAIGNEHIREIGWVLNDANAELIDLYGPTHYYLENVRMFLWLGDPALKLWTGPAGPIGWTGLGGWVVSLPSMIVDDQGRIHIFVVGGDWALWDNIDGVWYCLGGSLASAPFPVKDSYGKIHVLVRGSDGALWDLAFDTSAWTAGWYGFGGAIAEMPTATQYWTGNIVIMVRGIDNALWAFDLWDPVGMSGNWVGHGGSILGVPYAMMDTSGNVHAFVQGSDNALWDHVADGPGSFNWYGLGGVLSPGQVMPTAVNEPNWPGYVAVMVRGADDSLWVCDLWPDKSPHWFPLGGYIISGGYAITDAAGYIHTFVKGGDGAAWENVFASWNPAGAQWRGQGGVLHSYSWPPVAFANGYTRMAVIGADSALWKKVYPTVSPTMAVSQDKDRPLIEAEPSGPTDISYGGDVYEVTAAPGIPVEIAPVDEGVAATRMSAQGMAPSAFEGGALSSIAI